MSKKSIIIYWLLLLVPAVLISVAAVRLLSHEQERISQAQRETILTRARAVAETIQLTVQAVEDELTLSLKEIPPGRLEQTLLDWEEQNPIIRNAFIFKTGRGLVYPRQNSVVDDEKKLFMSRYNMLFSGNDNWPDKSAPDVEAQQKVPAKAGAPSDLQKLRTGRKKLISLARVRSAKSPASPKASDDAASSGRASDGWIPWFAENRLHLLGWVRQENSELIYGLELEMISLLSRLVTDLPTTPPQGTSLAVINGGGQTVFQAGNPGLEKSKTPAEIISLAPILPHWQVKVSFTERQKAGSGFVILSGLLLIIFLAAILLGGGLMTWQAHRNMVEARQKTSFVSNVSHELKTPLTSIRMYAELLESGRVEDKSKAEEYLSVIVDESQRLTRLVNNVLNFSRLEQGQKKYNLEMVDLADHLENFLAGQNPRLKKAGLEMKFTILERPASINIDRDALEQVLLNLIDNAIKYASGGGALDVELTESDGSATVSIMDRGPGVPASHRMKIFEKFHRVDNSLTSSQPGSGLGLSISRRLLNDMKGDITYRERTGGGSIFTITFNG